MRRATCSTRFNYFVRFLSLACIIVSFSPSLVSINFQHCFDLFFGSSCGSICEDKLSTNIHSWGKRVSKLFHKSWIEVNLIVKSLSILRQINRKRRGGEGLHARIYYRRMNIQRLFNIDCFECIQLRIVRIRIVENCE